MKNIKILSILLISTILFSVKSVQGQSECEHPMINVTTKMNGDDVSIKVSNVSIYDNNSPCRAYEVRLFRIRKLDSRPNGVTMTFIDNALLGFDDSIEIFRDNDLPSGEYYYDAEVQLENGTFYYFSSEGFTVGGATSYDIGWTDQLGVSQNGTQLTRTVNTGWDCNSGAASVNAIPSGEDGWVEMIVTENSSTKFFGLSNSNTDACRWSISHSVYFENQKLHIYEGGQYVGLYENCTIEDVIRVERIGTTIEYKKNGVTFYTSHKPSSGSLIADVSIKDRNGVIGDSRCSHPI